MSYDELAAILGDFEGFELVGVRREPSAVPPRLILELQAKPEHSKRCHRCGELVWEIHEVSERRVRDLPVGEWETWIIFPRARVQCPRCGPTVEAVPWVDRYQRMTKRLADKIARLACVLPIKHVAEWFGVSWDTVKQIDQRALVARLGPIDAHWDDLRVLAIDEFAMQRGHRYATVVADPTMRRVLWVGRGRDQGALREFFVALGPARCAQIEAVVLDMWAAYALEVRAYCPQAQLVYDLFHVVAKYGREVIDRVRVDQTNQLVGPAGGDARRTARRVIKGTRWLLLRNREHVTTRDDRIRLRDLLHANRPLFIVYVLKEDLKQLWRFRYPRAAWRWWRHWRQRALASRLPALRKFVTILERHLEGIISHCRYPLHTGVLEGINNKIKVLKRMAYGFRDDAYFFLKIRA